MDEQKITAEQDFSRIAAIALSAGMQGFMDERFVNAINNALATSASIEALIITGPEGEYGFEKQQGHAIKWIDNSPRFINKLIFSSQSYYRPLPIHDLRNANIKAVANAFNYNDISRILKETLLLILIGFLIASVTMLFQLLFGRPVEKQEYTSEYAEQPVKPIKPAEHESETIIINAAPPITEPGPKGLYSSRTNIGWEEYINDRLDSELHRCSSTEKDLTLIMMEFTDITNDNMYKQAAEEAVTFFSSRDLLFEFGRYGITIILPGVDLDTGIGKSEKFHQRIMEKFPNGSNTRSSLCIGLTSRSGRLLNADRILFEGMQALEKAKKDPKSSIIAFKSDPEKYRDFIRSNS